MFVSTPTDNPHRTDGRALCMRGLQAAVMRYHCSTIHCHHHHHHHTPRAVRQRACFPTLRASNSGPQSNSVTDPLARLPCLVPWFVPCVVCGCFYVRRPELYPTEIRSTGHAVSNAFARLGAVGASYWVASSMSNQQIAFLLSIVGVTGGLAAQVRSR